MKELAEQTSQLDGREPLTVEMPNGQKLTFLHFSRIRHFAGHPFRLYTGERLADMVDSISRNGILTPPIVRRIYDDPDYDFEMLAGHNRMNAGTLAGLEGTLCVVKEDMSYSDAMMYVIETNLFQRSFKDLLPSEKAAVLTLRYSELFSQGKRNDIRRELEQLEDSGTGETCGNRFHRSSRDTLGIEYELTGRSIANYVRIGQHLSEELKIRLDNGEIILRDCLQLSHLQSEEQKVLDSLLSRGPYRVNKNKATMLRMCSEKGTMDDETMVNILIGTGNRTSVTDSGSKRGVRIKYQTYGQFFAPDVPDSEIEEIIGKALRMYFASEKERSAST